MNRYGAIDIGSNSIRMQAAEVVAGEPIKTLAEDREVTRLGESVFKDGVVSPEAMDLTGRVLRRMADGLKACGVDVFRAVATSAVRDARNQDEFLLRAQLALGGVRPEIISGAEEARLIHLGVQTRWPHPSERTLIIDIGGGSAEVIESNAGEVQSALSKPLGAVRLTRLFFSEDPPSPKALQQFEDFVLEKTAAIKSEISGGPFDRVIATAATGAAVIRAVEDISTSDGEKADRVSVDTAQVRGLYESLARKNLRERQSTTGIGARRAEIVVAGAGVLALLLEGLGAEQCAHSSAGVRDGVIADLAAHAQEFSRQHLDADQRQTVRRLASRCGVDPAHSECVARLAGRLFEALQPLHQLGPEYGGLLEAAAYLHDAGHFVSSTRHHRHSFYLVANADLPGFVADDRFFIANLCRYHRKNMPKSSQENFNDLSAQRQQALLLLIPVLRIADSLDRSHRQLVAGVEVEAGPEEVTLRLSGSGDLALEQWAAEQHAGVFAQVYGARLATECIAAL